MANNSAPVEMSGGQTGQESGLRLEEPTDAVKMKAMGQSSAAAASKPEGHDDKERETRTSVTQDTEDAAETAAAIGVSNVVAMDEQARRDKGKERELEARQGSPPAPPSKTDDNDEMAIGASTEDITKPSSKGEGPVCHITLLISSGKRHPYKIDEKYLAKRNVSVPGVTESGGMDPFSISVYTLKELILREWRDEWEGKPDSPSSIRLIHFGKLLDDKDQLKQYKFSPEASNVVHMNVRPTDLGDDEEPKSSNKNARDGGRDEGTRCCVIL